LAVPDSALRFVALVPAAGRGERFGGEVPKQLVLVAGRPLLAWTVERLLACGPRRLTVAVPADLLERARDLVPHDSRLAWVAGGATRQESVALALAATAGSADELVLVHDGARPAVEPADVRATLQAARAAGAAVLGRRVEDTLKRLAGDLVRETLDRSQLFRAETPQVVRRDVLEQALRRAAADGFVGTDEVSLVERWGGVPIRAVEASAPNPKLTRPADLPLLAALLGS
jgi:2-C-methyl-D-erythritol 4-phosphate cytidylyltransferase